MFLLATNAITDDVFADQRRLAHAQGLRRRLQEALCYSAQGADDPLPPYSPGGMKCTDVLLHCSTGKINPSK